MEKLCDTVEQLLDKLSIHNHDIIKITYSTDYSIVLSVKNVRYDNFLLNQKVLGVRAFTSEMYKYEIVV